MKAGVALVAALAVIAAPPPGKEPRSGGAPRFDAWRIIGPGGGGSMFFPTISPHNPGDVLVRCDMTGAYVTHDGGESWRMFNLRGTVGTFVFDPVDPKVVYATSNGLWRSRDAARTWELVLPDPATVERIDRVGDHAGDVIVTREGRGPRVSTLAVDPADSRTLYAVLSGAGGAALHVSTDWGRTWKKSADLTGGARHIWIDPKSPRGDRTLYVARLNSISMKRGGAWKEGAAADSGGWLDVSGGFLQDGRFVVYAASRSAICVSSDGGSSWQKPALPGPARYTAIATSLHHPETAYVSYTGLQEGGTSWSGVAKTTDGGNTWTPVWKESREPAANIRDNWLSAVFGPGWGGRPTHLGVAPNNPEICYGTDSGRTMRTTDGGRTWQGVYSKKMDGGWTSAGLDVTTNYGVHFDPFDQKRVFITYTDIGLFRSEDGGASWLSSTQGVPKPWVNTTYWMEFDPKVKGRAWAVASGIHDLPRPKMWRSTPMSRYNGGVVVSEDGGRTWQVASPSLPPTAATHILLDPASPASSRTLYITGFGRGVFKSTDGGKNWALKNSGIEGAEPLAWRLSRNPAGTLYLVVARRSEDGSIGTPSDGALYRSTDGAEHWTRLSLPEGVNGPNGLTIDPRDPKRLYLAAWGRAVKPADVDGGVYLSVDGGAHWKRVLDRDQHIYDVTADPSRPGVLYACGFSSSAWRSADRGLTWRRIRGYNFKWGHRVISDPSDPARIFVTTYGGSVWYGPAEGDPKAAEDIVTPQAAYH